ncbi:MAG: hypothetical protein MJ188_11835 [Treponema sp.]|nr:hypothetical protein [Treponema sp.]
MSKDVNVKIKADSSQAEKGLKKIESNINKLGNNKTVKAVGNLSRSFFAVRTSLKLVVSAFKNVNAAMKESAELYKNRQKQKNN